MADGTRGGSNDAALPLIATDDAGAAGMVQIVKLALSADGSAVPITADADGLLVNLGANNDVTVASLPLPTGAATSALQLPDGHNVTIDNAAGAAAVNIQDGGNAITVDGTVTANLAAGTNNIGDVDVASLPNGLLDSFGHIVTGSIYNQVDIQFYRDTPANLTTVTTANGGTATATGGMATFATSSSASSTSKGVSLTTTLYTAGAEVYALFTAAFTGTGGASSYQRIGLHNTTDGFFIGYEATTFGVTVRTGGVSTQTAKASWNVDTLTGGGSSKFTRAGTPEAIDLTKLNVFRIRFGWVGSAPILFEVLSPDGEWVVFHKIRQPNLAATPSVQNADLPVTCEVGNAATGAVLAILSNCWAAGTTQALGALNATISNTTLAELSRSVITGVTTGGGGGYVNVKVAPSGALATDAAVSSISAGDNNIGNVDIVTMPNVTLAAGTNTNEVVGDVAHSAGVAGNPIIVGGVSQNTDDTAPPNRVDAEADATRFATDRDGSLFVRPHGPQVWTYHENSSNALTDATVHAATGDAATSLYVGTIVFSTGAATACNIFFEEGASTVIGPYYLEAVAGRGLAITFNPPRKITANTALTVTTSAAIAHSIDVTGFTAQG